MSTGFSALVSGFCLICDPPKFKLSFWAMETLAVLNTLWYVIYFSQALDLERIQPEPNTIRRDTKVPPRRRQQQKTQFHVELAMFVDSTVYRR